MKSVLVLLLLLGLYGCAEVPKKPDAIIPEKVVRIDPRALIPCQELTLITENSFDAVLASSIANAEIYLDCRNKQNASIKLLKEFANIKDKP
jgi:hypothetical protein